MSVALTDQVWDVLIVGAGLSGIGAARELKKQLPQLKWCIVEARERMGGTWDLFRYPGVRSDSDKYTFGYGSRPWLGSNTLASGDEILRYIQASAQEAGVDQHIHYGMRLQNAQWCSREACWTLTLQATASTTVQVRARYLHLCSGYYDYAQGHTPDFVGQADFKGTWVHPQFWPDQLDTQGKRLLIIGSGATAVTLLPHLAQSAQQVTLLQRTPTYMISLPYRDTLAAVLQACLPQSVAYHLTRWKNLVLSSSFYRLCRWLPNVTRRLLIAGVVRGMRANASDTAQHLTPPYNPWDQRLCVVPSGDFFDAVRQRRARLCTGHIARVTAKGVTLQNGEHLEADIIVCATGLRLQLLGGAALQVDEQTVDLNQHLIYKGMMLSDIPNMSMTFGYTNASWTLKADLTAHALCRVLRHMQRHKFDVVRVPKPTHIQARPMLDLSSGYVQRAQGLLPQQGDRFPWRVKQSYWSDWLAMRGSPLHDGHIRFERLAPASQETPP